MDPYLEGSLWTSVHTELSSAIARQLSPKLRPKYLALPTERFVLEEPDSVAVAAIYPDVSVLSAKAKDGGPGPPGGAVVAPVQVATVMPASVPHITIEIRDVKERRLVTAIEVLSPTNKRGDGRMEYLAKRRRILLSTAHLMEIDLLHEGTRVPMLQPLPPAPYYVLVSREERRPWTDVWPIRVEEPLPVVPVPLLAGDPDVALDLQLALTTMYDALGFDLAIDYGGPPEVTLPPAEASWAAQHLGREDRRRPKGS
jgi:hypothetical protein